MPAGTPVCLRCGSAPDQGADSPVSSQRIYRSAVVGFGAAALFALGLGAAGLLLSRSTDGHASAQEASPTEARSAVVTASPISATPTPTPTPKPTKPKKSETPDPLDRVLGLWVGKVRQDDGKTLQMRLTVREEDGQTVAEISQTAKSGRVGSWMAVVEESGSEIRIDADYWLDRPNDLWTLDDYRLAQPSGDRLKGTVLPAGSASRSGTVSLYRA